jgi:FtsH-binding integral membrane protein
MLFIVQVGFVSGGRYDMHRSLGQASAVLFAVMLLSGLWIAWDGSRNGSDFERATGRPVLLWPLANLVAFVAFFLLGYSDRRRADFHKRWMLLATITLAVPAFVRIGRLVDVPIMGPVKGLLISNMLVLLLAAHDFRTRGNLHPATLWGGGLWLLSQPLRWWIHHSPAWLALADRILLRD